jgi:uncharacterized protein YbaR (Trm112 family)
MVHPDLLEILACPEDKTPVRLATPEELEALNARIRRGEVRNRGGQTIGDPVAEGLVREDGRYLYRVDDDIPIMLVEEAIPLATSGE